MKVALINARVSYSSVMPIGLLSIGTLLDRDGHRVRVIDDRYDDAAFIDHLTPLNPDIIGISFLTTEFQRANELIGLCRYAFPDSIICAGGHHVTALPERSLRELDIDFCVLSEGELTMEEICRETTADIKDKKISHIKGIAFLDGERFIRTGPRPFIPDLDALPIIDRGLLVGEPGWYFTLPGTIRGQLIERCATIMTSRGCPGNCYFCSSRGMWSNRVRYRSADNVLDEIELLIDTYGIKGLFFLDDTFTAKRKWLLDFCKKFKKRGIRLKWGCSARVSTINDEVLAAMKEIGCVQLDFGVESGCDTTLRTLRKGQNVRQIRKAFEAVHRNRMKCLACFIIGVPGETREEMDMTFQLAREINPDFALFSILTPLPGSPLYDMALENNWLPGHPDFGKDWSIRHSDMPVMNVEISKEELLRIRQKMEDHFFFRNYLYYLIPLARQPKFILQLIYQLFRAPKKYAGYLAGAKTRKFSGFIETIYYDYKEWMAKKL